MTDPSNRTIYLLSQYAESLCTPEETDELFDIIRASQDDETLYLFLQQEWTRLQPVLQKEPDWNSMFPTITSSKEKRKIIRIQPWKWVAAAAIILMIVGGWWMIERRSQVTSSKPQVAVHDVPAPSNTRAVITLADGSKIYLDSAGNGILTQQNNVKVIRNANGEILYSPNHQITQSPIAYNTLFNPRGSKVISLTLSDGTKVWLNSESSLKYPIAFTSNTREVEITGEAYFEVKHNSKQPFKVHLPNGGVVEDIGTSFNINSYTDEQEIKTTLIEGSVHVFASPDHQITKSLILKPGEQSVINRSSLHHYITTSPNIDEVIAWKTGWFDFDNIPLPTIMRQLSRWYDIDVVYESTPSSDTYGGRISKDLSLSNVLNSLEVNGAKFKIEGRKIIVSK